MNLNLHEILIRQKETANLLETEIKNFESLDLTKRNNTLEKENEKLNEEVAKLREKVTALSENNSQLRNTIYSKLYSEKLSLIENSQQKLNAYFSYGQSNEYNRLIQFENEYKHMINSRMGEIKSKFSLLDEKLKADIASRTYNLGQELSVEMSEAMSVAKKELAARNAEIRQQMDAGYQSFKDENVTEQDMQRIAKQSNWERFLGLNVINKIGIGLIILGVIFATQYTYTKIGDGLKSILAFGLGVVFIAVGELLSRKKASVFSLGITSGGVAVTYIALTVSYFIFDVLTLYSAALLCVVITIGAFVLCIRHKSQVIATFALIGGFLPLVILDALNQTLVYSAMLYFLILGGFAFALSFKKKWIVTAFFGLTLNVIATVLMSGLFSEYSGTTEKTAFIIYVALSFITYTLIPIIGTFSEKLSFKKSDITLIGINTFFSSIILYLNFINLKLVELNGLIPLVFMIIYIGLGQLVKWKMRQERDIRMLFFITAVTFFILIVPMHFDTVWFTLGWLVQGVGLAVYGILAEKRKFVVSGFVINAFCLGAFLMFDLSGIVEHFLLKYAAITFSSLLLMAMFVYKHESNAWVKTLKYACAVNLGVFALYLIHGHFKVDYPWNCLISIPAVFALAFIIPRIKAIRDVGMTVISHMMYIVGILWLVIINFSAHLPQDVNVVAGAFAYSAVNITALLALGDFLQHYAKKSALRIEWLPFLLSLFFTFILTQNLVVLYDVSFAGMTISIVYAALALLWCIFGFYKRFTFMRRFGLAMSLLVVTKLFIIDMWELSEGYRIITYFALGVALIGISFVYQQFTKKLEAVVKSDDGGEAEVED